jgi:phosphatidate cytidylyltransferase
MFSSIVFAGISQNDFKLSMVFLISICIFSDIGGLIFGKLFKGKKLTKISPNKTISGSIGSFVLSLFLVPIFYFLLQNEFNNPSDLIILAILVSFFCQLGDLFISFLKRKAKVKDTGNLLPGHGGVLDRIDGILFAVPIGIAINEFLVVVI